MKSLSLVIILTLLFSLNACSDDPRLVKLSQVTTVTKLSFDHTPSEVGAICKEQQDIIKNTVDAIGKVTKEKATFENTVGKFERVSAEFSNTLNPVTFLAYVSPDADVRKAARDCMDLPGGWFCYFNSC